MDATTGSSLLFRQLTQAGCARVIYYGEKNEINMENWKRFLTESITSGSQQPTKFTGIIQLQPTDVKYLQQLQQKIIKNTQNKNQSQNCMLLLTPTSS